MADPSELRGDLSVTPPSDRDALRQMLLREIAGKCFNDEAARHAVRSILAALEGAGLVVVPLTPTVAMFRAADGAAQPAAIYRAMALASPFVITEENAR